MRSICLLGVRVAVDGGRVVAIYINMIMVYFERKGCIQQNLYLNCTSGYKKVLKRCRMVRCQVIVIVTEHFVLLT